MITADDRKHIKIEKNRDMTLLQLAVESRELPATDTVSEEEKRERRIPRSLKEEHPNIDRPREKTKQKRENIYQRYR